MIIITQNVYSGTGASGTPGGHALKGLLIIAALIIFGLVVTIGVLIYTLWCLTSNKS